MPRAWSLVPLAGFATLLFMKSVKNLFKFLMLCVACGLGSVFAYDGDMDEYREFREDLALVRDSYVTCVNMIADENPEKVGGSWQDLEFEAPATAYVKVEELAGGFKLKGAHGAYKLEVDVRVSLNPEGDPVYEVKHKKGSNAPGKDIAGEVFR